MWAIGVIAQHALANRSESVEDYWENYPEIGEQDWEAIVQHADELRGSPDDEDYREAYALLAARAEHTEE